MSSTRKLPRSTLHFVHIKMEYTCTFFLILILLAVVSQCQGSSPFSDLDQFDNLTILSGSAQQSLPFSTSNPGLKKKAQAFSSSFHRHYDRMPATRSVLVGGYTRKISNVNHQIHSHVVRINSDNGDGFCGTGLLLKNDFVLTSMDAVPDHDKPSQYTVELGNASATVASVSHHTQGKIALLKISPPLSNTGAHPMPNSPKGFFWPISWAKPDVNSKVTIYKYTDAGAGRSLLVESLPVMEVSNNQVSITGSNFTRNEWDVGNPVFSEDEKVVLGVLQPSLSRRKVIMSSTAANRDWIFDNMKSSCSVHGKKVYGISVEADSLTYYHCEEVRAERLEVFYYALPHCSTSWKAIRIRDGNDKEVVSLETKGDDKEAYALLHRWQFSSSHFYADVWKTQWWFWKRRKAIVGPFHLDDYMDGGLHFTWCAS